jgi:hypothetical protein
MSCIFDDRDASGGFLDSRHIRKLSEQVHRNNRGESPLRVCQGLRMNGQEPRINVDEDWSMARHYYGPE